MRDAFRQFFRWSAACSRGKIWWIRLPVWGFCAFLLMRYLRDPMYTSIFAGINLGVHELGHVIFRPLGLTASIFGGTLTQCAAPIASVWMFARQRDVFAFTFSFTWLATNYFGIAKYVEDARTMAIPLLSPFGGEVFHDWNYLFSRIGWLAYDDRLGHLIRMAGYGCLIVGLVYGGWVLWVMSRQSPPAHVS